MNSTRLMQAVAQIPGSRGAGIASIGDRQCTFVRDSDHQSGLRTYVVFQQIERTGLSLVSAFPSSTSRTAAPNQDRVASTVGTELRRAALDCSGVVFSAKLAGGIYVGFAGHGWVQLNRFGDSLIGVGCDLAPLRHVRWSALEWWKLA